MLTPRRAALEAAPALAWGFLPLGVLDFAPDFFIAG